MPTEETTAPAAAPAADNSVPSPKESIANAMKRLGGDGVFEGDTKPEPAAAEAPEAAADPATAEKAKRAAKQTDADPTLATGELEQLRALATKLGLALEDGKVTTTERVKLRQERTENLRAIAKAEQDAIAKVQAARAEWEPKIGKVEAFEAAVKAGDYDAIAKLAGFDDWNKLQDDQIQRLADPNYKRVRELEERLKREDDARAKAAEENQRQQATQAELQAQANHKRQLAQLMSQSPEPLVKALHDDPSFVNAVFNVQRRVWQESGGRDVLTAEAAIKWKPDGGGVSLWEELKKLYERAHGAFGTVAAPAAAPAAGTPEKPKPKTAPVTPPAPAPRERAPFKSGFGDDARRRIAAAIEEDRRKERIGA